MMGPVYIEMALLNVISDWLEGSGWLGVFNKAKIRTPDIVDTFLWRSHIKKIIYAHFISLFALHSIAPEVFQDLAAARMKIGKTI